MEEKLLQIIQRYGVNHQLRKFNEEAFELEEAIIYERATSNYGDEKNDYKCIKHITEEIADCLVMLNQFVEHYEIQESDIYMIMEQKIDRQLERMKEE